MIRRAYVLVRDFRSRTFTCGLLFRSFVRAFIGRLPAECLKEHWFLSLDDAQTKINAWRTECNEVRPHGALGNKSPKEFARNGQKTEARTIRISAA